MGIPDDGNTLHIALRVQDIDRTLRFYRELGWPIRKRSEHHAELCLGDHVVLEIEQSDVAREEPRLELRIDSEDPGALLALARRLGPIREYQGGEFKVVDPDGIPVRVGPSAAAVLVDEASRESFPASDAPSFTGR